MLTISYLLGWSIGAILLFAAVSIAGAVTLCTAMDTSVGAAPKFPEALKTSAIALAIAACIAAGLCGAIWLLGKQLSLRGIGIIASLFFLANAGTIVRRLRTSQGKEIGIGRACWITTMQLFFTAMLVGAGMKVVDLMTV